MSNKNNALFQGIQNQLETLQGSDEAFLFLARQDNRGIVNGDDDELVSLVLFNMLRYDVIADIFNRAVAAYEDTPEQIKRHVRNSKPTHEIVIIDGDNQNN
jgi:hypothetical protein